MESHWIYQAHSSCPGEFSQHIIQDFVGLQMFVFLMIVILTGLRWTLKVILICILLTNRILSTFMGNFFLFLRHFYFSQPIISSLLMWILALLVFTFHSQLYILDIKAMSDAQLDNIFFCVVFPFSLVMMVLFVEYHFNFMQFPCQYFRLYSLCYWSTFQGVQCVFYHFHQQFKSVRSYSIPLIQFQLSLFIAYMSYFHIMMCSSPNIC